MAPVTRSARKAIIEGRIAEDRADRDAEGASPVQLQAAVQLEASKAGGRLASTVRESDVQVSKRERPVASTTLLALTPGPSRNNSPKRLRVGCSCRVCVGRCLVLGAANPPSQPTWMHVLTAARGAAVTQNAARRLNVSLRPL